MVTTYKVVWEIDVDAETQIEAAKLARSIQRDPSSRAQVFLVYNNSNGDVGVIAPGFSQIDLDELEGL